MPKIYNSSKILQGAIYMSNQEIKTKVEKIFEPTIDNAIRDMRLAKMLHLTKK